MTTVIDAQNWCGVVLNYSLRLERVTHDSTSNRILFHLTLTLATPIPSALLDFSNYLCLGWPLGGIWKITKRDGANRTVTCVAWKKTELSVEEVAELAKQYAPAPTALPKTLFEWKMQLAKRKHVKHWFVREVGLPPAYASELEVPADMPLAVKLFAGLTPVEVALVVNSIQSLDTVTQRFTADVTWELTLPNITAIRDDSVLREFLDLLEFNEEEFEYSNLTDVRSEKPLVMAISLDGEKIEYVEQLVSMDEPVEQRLHDLKYSRRLIAEFIEEMTLQTFPLDQQKLTFSFNMSRGIAPFIPIAPISGNPGRFAIKNFKLGNVWNVVCGDKLFIGDVDDAAKVIRFEMMLERRSMYYLTNVAIPAAIITYLCFSSYAPLKDAQKGDAKGSNLMDTDARLQIVLTLLLTAVTFKNQVAALIPQVSYFTTLDKYVFVCFIITCMVAVENALFPLIARWWGKADSWREYYLLWISVWVFTIINVVWGVQLYRWTCERDLRTRVLLDVTVYLRAIANQVRIADKEPMVRKFLASRKYRQELLPEFLTTTHGDVFVKLPSDSLAEDSASTKHESGNILTQAEEDVKEHRREVGSSVAVNIQDARRVEGSSNNA